MSHLRPFGWFEVIGAVSGSLVLSSRDCNMIPLSLSLSPWVALALVATSLLSHREEGGRERRDRGRYYGLVWLWGCGECF